jgi:hypothetical protein
MTIGAADYARVDFLQGSDGAEMERLFAQKIAGLIAENADREKDGKAPLGVKDIGLSGGTDVFVLHLLITTIGPVGWKPAELPLVAFRAWMGADQESLEDYQEAAIASLRNGSTWLDGVAMGVAGAGRTSRFMGFMAGVRRT